MKKISCLYVIVLLALLVLSSCDDSQSPIALGRSLDLYAPELALARPDFMENISDTALITGIVGDDTDVATVLVTIENIARQWRNFQGTWQTRENVNSEWQPIQGEWTVIGTGKYEFSVKVRVLC